MTMLATLLPLWMFVSRGQACTVTGATTFTDLSGYNVYLFKTSGGTLTVARETPAKFLVVGGGGAGGGNTVVGGGGGGAGAVIYDPSFALSTAVSYTVTIGEGGWGFSNGGDTSFGNVFLAKGGGGGGGNPASGKNGGSGGGGSGGERFQISGGLKSNGNTVGIRSELSGNIGGTGVEYTLADGLEFERVTSGGGGGAGTLGLDGIRSTFRLPGYKYGPAGRGGEGIFGDKSGNRFSDIFGNAFRTIAVLGNDIDLFLAGQTSAPGIAAGGGGGAWCQSALCYRTNAQSGGTIGKGGTGYRVPSTIIVPVDIDATSNTGSGGGGASDKALTSSPSITFSAGSFTVIFVGLS